MLLVWSSANREVFVGIPECPRNAQFGKSIQLATISRASLTLVFTDGVLGNVVICVSIFRHSAEGSIPVSALYFLCHHMVAHPIQLNSTQLRPLSPPPRPPSQVTTTATTTGYNRCHNDHNDHLHSDTTTAATTVATSMPQQLSHDHNDHCTGHNNSNIHRCNNSHATTNTTTMTTTNMTATTTTNTTATTNDDSNATTATITTTWRTSATDKLTQGNDLCEHERLLHLGMTGSSCRGGRALALHVFTLVLVCKIEIPCFSYHYAPDSRTRGQ